MIFVFFPPFSTDEDRGECKDGGSAAVGESVRGTTAGASSSAAVRYRGREMECLSIMVKEGDDWLKLLAEVLEGTTTISSSAAAAAAEVESAEKASSSSPADTTTSRRTSTRAGRGVRKPMFMDADFDITTKVNECSPQNRKCVCYK